MGNNKNGNSLFGLFPVGNQLILIIFAVLSLLTISTIMICIYYCIQKYKKNKDKQKQKETDWASVAVISISKTKLL